MSQSQVAGHIACVCPAWLNTSGSTHSPVSSPRPVGGVPCYDWSAVVRPALATSPCYTSEAHARPGFELARFDLLDGLMGTLDLNPEMAKMLADSLKAP